MKVKQTGKNLLNRFFLPFIYNLYKHKKIDEKKIIFADSNSYTLPESMQSVYDECRRRGYDCREMFIDFRSCGFKNTVIYLCRFMKEFATARAVFICNYFLPVNSCRKRSGTTVVQLWHSCGLYKKFAYDTEYDISPKYKGNVTKNVDFFTLSSPACIEVWADALRLKGEERKIMMPTGVARCDRYFDNSWRQSQLNRLYTERPDFQEKKIILWAPTFRGTAADPIIVGEKEIESLAKQLGEGWVLIKKIHPMATSNDDGVTLTASELFPAADVLVTDFSSLICEYALFKKPVVVFAEDYDEFMSTRGAYFDPESDFPYPVVKHGKELKNTVIAECERFSSLTPDDEERLNEFIKIHMASCSGTSTQMITDLALK